MTCPIGSDCNAVINSEYSRFLGIPLETIGIFYYGLILLGYSAISTANTLSFPTILFLLITISTLAFLFSAYLTIIQGVVLREWCSWCLFSAFLSTLIWSASLASSGSDFVAILKQNEGVLFFIHLIAIALGIGATTIADIFFLRFLKDFKISIEEANILKIFNQIVWFAIGISSFAILGLYLGNINIAFQSPQFIAEVFILTIIILNSTYLTLVVSPRMIRLSFNNERYESRAQDKAKKMAFASGAVSLCSWYSLLALVSPFSINLDIHRIIISFVGLVIISVAVSQVVHNHIESKAKSLGY